MPSHVPVPLIIPCCLLKRCLVADDEAHLTSSDFNTHPKHPLRHPCSPRGILQRNMLNPSQCRCSTSLVSTWTSPCPHLAPPRDQIRTPETRRGISTQGRRGQRGVFGPHLLVRGDRRTSVCVGGGSGTGTERCVTGVGYGYNRMFLGFVL